MIRRHLAGRIALRELHPFSLSELQRCAHPPHLLQDLFKAKDPAQAAEAVGRGNPGFRRELLRRIIQGAYPVPALANKAAHRVQWFESYRTTYIERDVRDLQAIEHLPDFGRLMALAASRTGQILNFADLGRDAGLPYATLRRYMNILQQTYQILLVPPYFSNRTKRLMKAPKLYWTDTGLASHLLDLREPSAVERDPKIGALVETWAAQELQKLLSLSPEPMRLYGWRTQTGQEVDFLIEKGQRVLAIEVKWDRQIDHGTLRAFQTLRESLGRRFVCGIILYGGEDPLVLDPTLIALPLDLFFKAHPSPANP